ncbi:hypothetical protein JCM10449v2_004307 [Rhodotorula kratochvilovae]
MSVWLLVRTILYVIVIFSSFLAWVLAAAFIGKTKADWGVYYGSSACVLVAGLLGFFVLPVLHFAFHRRNKVSPVASLLAETIVVFILWALFLGGAAGMADRLPGLSSSFCDASICSLGRAVQAFAWIAWVALLFLLIGLLTFGILATTRHGSGVWMEPFSTDVGAARGSGPHATEKGVGHTGAAAPAAAPAAAAPATRPVEMAAV